MLSVQRVRPVISRWSSLRRRSRPISLAASAALLGGGHRHLGGRGRRRVLHGLHDVVVARAAAQVALEPEPDLLLGGMRVLLEQVDALHDHPGRAEAALQPVALAERLLHRVQLPVLRQPLDRRDVGAVGLDRQHVAGPDAAAVQMDGAGPQLLVSHPMTVPVFPRRSRRYCTSSIRGSTSSETDAPSTVRLIRVMDDSLRCEAVTIPARSGWRVGGLDRWRLSRGRPRAALEQGYGGCGRPRAARQTSMTSASYGAARCSGPRHRAAGRPAAPPGPRPRRTPPARPARASWRRAAGPRHASTASSTRPRRSRASTWSTSVAGIISR